jgi:adenosyl cobinamide kinase/adenosyl cobinamide phosphate guanylyltransferase
LGLLDSKYYQNEERRIHWYTAEKEKTNDSKVIKDQTYCIFLINHFERFVNNTISLDFQRP